MRVSGIFAVISSTLLLAACASHRPPVVYTTPGGQVISAGPDARAAADHALETTLHSEMARYGELARVNPNVQFYAMNGTVTITGPVRNDRERQMIDTMVRGTPGVTGVNDQLHVVYAPTGVQAPAQVYPAPSVPTPAVGPRIEAGTTADEPLARRIADQLGAQGVPSDWLRDVTIRADQGAVYVRGYVASQQQREAIDSAIQRVQGVTTVYDQLQFR